MLSVVDNRSTTTAHTPEALDGTRLYQYNCLATYLGTERRCSMCNQTFYLCNTVGNTGLCKTVDGRQRDHVDYESESSEYTSVITADLGVMHCLVSQKVFTQSDDVNRTIDWAWSETEARLPRVGQRSKFFLYC